MMSNNKLDTYIKNQVQQKERDRIQREYNYCDKCKIKFQPSCIKCTRCGGDLG